MSRLSDYKPNATKAARFHGSLVHRLLAGGAWAAAGRAVSICCFLVSTALLAHGLQRADMGLYLLLSVWIAIFIVMGVSGLSTLVVKLIREAITTGRPRRALQAIRLTLILTLVLGLSSAAVFVAVVYALGESLSAHQLVALWPWAVSCIVLGSLTQTAAEILKALDEFHWSALLGGQNGGAFSNLLFMLAIAVLLMSGELNLVSCLWLQTIILGVALGSAAPILWWRCKNLGAWEHETTTAEAREPQLCTAEMLRESYPILLTQLAATGLLHFDLLVLSAFCGRDDVAVYGAVKRLLVFVGAPLMLMNVALPPFIAELYASGQISKLIILLRTTATVAAATTLPALAILIWSPGRVLTALYGPDYERGAALLAILAISYLAFVVTGSGGLTLVMTGRARWAMGAALGTGAAYAVVTLALTYRYGTLGAAVSAALFTVITNVLIAALVKRHIGAWPCATMSGPILVRGWRSLSSAWLRQRIIAPKGTGE